MHMSNSGGHVGKERQDRWWEKPIRNLHITIRECDVETFDAERLIADVIHLNVNYLTFLTAGYFAIYPSQIPFNRPARGLGDKDLCRDIVETAHRHGLKVGTCVDTALGSRELLDSHPEWFARDIEGRPILATSQHGQLYSTCSMGPYIDEYILEIMREQLTKYDFDGAQYTALGFGGYTGTICHCSSCSRSFWDEYHLPIPEKVDWNNEVWRQYQRWRYTHQEKVWSRALSELKRIKPGIVVSANNVADMLSCRNSAQDLDRLQEHEDILKTEAQLRQDYRALGEPLRIQPYYWPAEEGRYLKTATQKPILTSCNYALLHPWRRSAVPSVMQKLWLAEVVANGANLFLHIGGWPYAQEDRRGLGLIRDFYGFLKDNEPYYSHITSYTNVALIMSQDTINWYGGNDAYVRYVVPFRGMYAALADAHIVFDIMSEKHISPRALEKYKLIVMPNLACMNDGLAQTIRSYVKNGGSLLATYETSLFDEFGRKRSDFLLADVFGASYRGMNLGPLSGDAGLSHARFRVNGYYGLKTRHPIFETLGDTDIVIAAGNLCHVEPKNNAKVLANLTPPFEVFPEGWAYPPVATAEVPTIIINEYGNGKVVYFPGQPDGVYHDLTHPDYRELLSSSVKWLLGDDILSELHAPVTVDWAIQYQKQEQRLVVHLINLTGKRIHDQVIPVDDLEIRVKLPCTGIGDVRQLSTGRSLSSTCEDGMIQIHVPKLVDYDVIVICLG